MRALRFVAFTLLLIPSLAFVCLDQRQADSGPVFHGLGPETTGGTYRAAQTVLPGLSGDLVRVRLGLACDGGGSVTMKIQGIRNDGAPDDGVVLSTDTVDVGVTTAPPLAMVDVNLSTPVQVSRGTPYAIVVSSATKCYVQDGPVGESYPGGSLYQGSDGFWVCMCEHEGAPGDLEFETYVDVPTPWRAERDGSAARP